MDSHLQQLVSYITAQLHAGQSPDVIMQQLVTIGWPADMVHQAFGVIQAQTLPTSMQPAPTATPAEHNQQQYQQQNPYEVQTQPIENEHPAFADQQPVSQQFATAGNALPA